MSTEEGLRTPSKGSRPGSVSSPSTRVSAKKATKNAKITNFFTKVDSPLTKNNSNSNQEHSENDHLQSEDISKDTSSNSMKMPETYVTDSNKVTEAKKQDFVFIIPSSDDDTNASTRGSGRRKKPPSVHSNNSKSCDGLILTNTNNELGLGRRRRVNNSLNQTIPEKSETDSRSPRTTPSTPTRSSGRDSKSRDSVPEKRMRTDSNQGTAQKINRIQPVMIGCRTKMVDFQSVPSDLNLPRDQAAQMIKEFFFVSMPEDFYLFWEFAKTINHRKPCSAFSLPNLDWTLTGPFDVLSGLITNFHGFKEEELLRHCRFYYDPPEFQTVIVKKDSALTHYGYFRDSPDQENPLVVMNQAAKNGQLHESGDNLFTLLKSELDASIGSLSKSSQEIPAFSSSSSPANPRSKSNESNCKQSQLEKAKAKQDLTIIRDKLLDFCASHDNMSCEAWSKTTTRKSKRCAKTLNSFGIVVPMNGDVGYRDLGIADSCLKTLLTRISNFKDDKSKCGQYRELYQIINNVNMANDEGDPGMGLELGIDLFWQGDPFFHKNIKFLLTKAYELLERHQFIKILEAHLNDRKKGDKVSLLDCISDPVH